MKNKTQNQVAIGESDDADTSFEQGNGINGKTHIKVSDADKQKGNFKNFEISKKTLKKLKARNVEYLFPVQSESYTSIHERNDCLIQASSGSGKTLAYVIPLVELLQSDKSVELMSGRAPRVLVVAPTRDTAKPISDNFQTVVNDLAVATIYTTKKKSDDQETEVTNGCDILVATPDRLKEFIDEEKVDLSQIKHVVLDEVDELVDELKKTLKNVFTSDQETKPQLIVLSEAAPDTLRKALKKFLSTDAVTLNLAEKTKEAAADDDEEEDDDDDEDAEKPVNGSSANTSGNADDGPRSLLSKQPNYTTYQLSTNDEIKGVGFVFTMLRKSFGDDFDAKGSVPQIAFTKDYKCAIFDLPSKYDEQLQSSWRDSARIQMGPITELPELDEASMNDHNIFTRGNKPGGGDRNSGRSNACFNCQKEGHKSFECPEGKNSGRNGGNRSGGGGGGGGCFNCGKDGHKSFECPEPKKAGGRGGSGGGGGGCFNCGKDGHKSFECSEPKKAGGRGGSGGGGGGCFNCGKDGHKSFECSEPKKAGGRGGPGGAGAGGCFNCGKDGHKSFECSEPKKERSSFGGRGGSRGGGAGGAKRSFGGGYSNGTTTTEPSNKKIKFDEDDE
ncbi:unnamed protein product [Adineta ricciae]|uniref:RNA helicase n=1 Tax=Adineta ricciae TaxID=249248 RepID=A0A813QBI0_ADIRI|nr:unnamed protein product [Adineta ricciae]